MPKRSLGFCFLVCWLPAAAFCAARHTPTVDELIELKRPSTPAISPDGRFVAYVVQQPNWPDNRYEKQIWLVNVHTKEVMQLTRANRSNSEPAWSPNGRSLGFISDRDGTRQIYVISPLGGQARRLNTEAGVSQFKWAPDSQRIAFTRSDPESEALKRRKEKYSDYELVRHDYTMEHLWVIDAHGGTPRRLTYGSEFTVGNFSWSPDGSRLAFDATVSPTSAADPTATLYVCEVASGLVRKLTPGTGPNSDPHWSPDGKAIVFQTAMGQRNYFTQNLYLGVISVEGGTVNNITGNFDERPTPLGWGRDGIYFSADQKTSTQLFKVNPKSRVIDQITRQEDGAHSAFSFAHDFKSLAYIEADSNHYPELYATKLNRFAPKSLTQFGSQLDDLAVATREVISWRNPQGIEIEGALMKPADFDPTVKHPLLVVIHGGPAATSRAVRGMDPPYYPKEIWAAKGAVILEPNYRGSNGYGAKFHRLPVRTLGAGNYEDIISGVDALIQKGWVDTNRVGAMGWSFGGFISAWIATNSDRFKAISIGAGPTDWRVFDAFTELPEITRQYLDAAPGNDPEIYRKSSPITYIAEARTPTMIQHGSLDPIVPLANAYELYQGLLDRGIPTRFYLYQGFGHSITTPKGNRAVMDHNLNWFNHYIWGEPDQEASP
jgi:dipeptidyl aminopeptidase/acylaminoacyl peptidase